jgi:hypothetical protein
MRLWTPKAQHTNGKSFSDSSSVQHDVQGNRPHVGGRFADRLSVQSMVRVFFADAGSGGKESVCHRHAVRHADRSERGYRCDEFDDFDPDGPHDEALEGLVSRFDICTDYASSLYKQFPDRHPGVDGWDGGLYIVRKRGHWEHDGDDWEPERDNTE